MPLELPQSYKLKYFFSSGNRVMGVLLLISNPNVAYFSHGPQGSSLVFTTQFLSFKWRS
jgi:hypothetical protein